jgi:hypothetical protein
MEEHTGHDGELLPRALRPWMELANRSPNKWPLIGTGAGAAFGHSVVATVAPRCGVSPTA